MHKEEEKIFCLLTVTDHKNKCNPSSARYITQGRTQAVDAKNQKLENEND